MERVLGTNPGNGAVLRSGRLVKCSDTGLFVLSNYHVSFSVSSYYIIFHYYFLKSDLFSHERKKGSR